MLSIAMIPRMQQPWLLKLDFTCLESSYPYSYFPNRYQPITLATSPLFRLLPTRYFIRYQSNVLANVDLNAEKTFQKSGVLWSQSGDCTRMAFVQKNGMPRSLCSSGSRVSHAAS